MFCKTISRFILVVAVFCFCHYSYAQQIRVLAYNIHHAENVNGKLDLEEIANIINRARPDVVALQEVDSMTHRTKKVDQLKELAALTGMNYFYGKTMDYDGGGYGVAILTKWPVLNSFITRLPGLANSEPRVVATVELQLKRKKRFLFSSVHLTQGRDSAQRMEQVKKIKEIFSTRKTPSILAGYFNARPYEGTMKDIIFSLYDDTDPLGQTRNKIDYVLVSKNHPWKKIQYEVIDERIASDHRPVLSVITWK